MSNVAMEFFMTTYWPINKVVLIPGLLDKRSSSARQKPRTRSPNQYILDSKRNVYNNGNFASWSYTALHPGGYNDTQENEIYRKAYGRFRDRVDDAAQLGADIAERKQAMNSLTARVGQLLLAARSLRSGNISGFVKALGIKKRTLRKSASDMGGVWLEYSYGWKPLVEDIHSASMVLQRPFPKFLICRGRAKASWTYTLSEGSGIYLGNYERVTFKTAVQIQSEVYVTNWVAWKANQLGLTNPLSIAWEVIPFSFVVDWFVPVGNYLQSLTDFIGLAFKNSMVTWYAVAYNDYYNKYWTPTHSIKERTQVVRTLTIPSPPKLQARFTGFYSARGANVIALLLSTLRDLPKVKRRHSNF
jgi:hypothetical protein